MRMISGRQYIFAFLLLGLFVTAILLPRSPLLQSIPPRDSGVFLYVGQQILDGRIPYHDMWDHKGPGVYYLNALGLFLGHGSQWGVWWIQWQFLVAAAILGYIALAQAFGHTPAVFSSLVWLVSLIFVLGGGNYTEEYALLFQFAALYLFWKSQKSERSFRYVFMIGVTLAGAFWLRPNTIGVHLSIILVSFIPALLSHHFRKALAWIAILSAGVFIVSLFLFGYMSWIGAWDDLMDTVFRYNFIYTTSTFENKLNAMMNGLSLLTQSSIAFMALATWIVGCLSFFSKSRQTAGYTPLFHLALVGLPVEFLLASASGRTYPHYYMTLLPIFAVLIAQLVSDFSNYFVTPEITFLQRKIDLKLIWVFAFLIAIGLSSFREIFDPVVEAIRTNQSTTLLVVDRVRSMTTHDDYLLMWGAETSYNFLTERRAPSRFIYQYPLYTCGYVTDAMITEFLNDIARYKPLIIDTSPTNQYVPPLNSDDREKWDNQAFAGYGNESCALSPRMADVFAFIAAHYRVAEVVPPKQWVIYQYTGDG